jgi:tRNA threonylcarbamoyladenosine biosynthesis protein TsaB
MDKHLAIAVDTSGRVGSAALGSSNNILESIDFTGQMRHAAELFPALIRLTENAGKTVADITDVYVTIGPGSFTGLRIGITLAKMMALASDVKIASVSSLDCVAMNAFDYINEQKREDIDSVAALIDAKRGQFFTCIYKKDGDFWSKTVSESMKSAEEILEMTSGYEKTLFNGEALKYYQGKFEASKNEFMAEKDWGIRAENVYKAAFRKALDNQFDDPQTLVPRYLRLSDAEENLLKRQRAQ